MAVLEFQKLPLGFRFRPTDEEAINHYLKRKINGKSKNEVEVIPEIDVCKCEPWDLPDKSLIKSDDSEWFFFAAKDRKYPNGNRKNRATEKGYWKATGKDRVIRSRSCVVGMKKTLVFHEGRAPKGVRSNWIMHEYRTTEPEYESGEQGGYVLYKLFRKEKTPGTNADEVGTDGFSPPSKSSPSDAHDHEADAPMDPESPISELQEELNMLPPSMQKLPAGIKRWPADSTEVTYPVKPEESNFKLALRDHEAKPEVKADTPLEDLLAQFCDAENDEPRKTDGFPYISSSQIPYTGHPFYGSNNQEPCAGLGPIDNTEEHSLNALLNSVLTPDECSGRPVIGKDTALGESACSSDLEIEPGLMQLEIEPGLMQGVAGVDSSDWFYGASLLPYDSFQMGGTGVYAETEPHLSTLYENACLLPYDSGGPDMFSVDAGADSLRDLFSSMDDSNYQNRETRSISEGTGIAIKPRSIVNPSALDNTHSWNGNAIRRVKLQSSLRKLPFSRQSGSNKNDAEDKMVTVKSPKALSESTESSVVEDDISCTGSYDGGEVKSEDQTTLSFQDLISDLDYPNSEASIRENDNDEDGSENEVQENLEDIASDVGEVVGPAIEDEPSQELSDVKPCSSISLQPELTMRLRSKFQNNSDNLQEASTRGLIVKKTHPLVGRTLWVFPVFLLLVTLGYGWFMIS